MQKSVKINQSNFFKILTFTLKNCIGILGENMKTIFNQSDVKIIKIEEDDFLREQEKVTEVFGQIFESYEDENDDFDEVQANKNVNDVLDDLFMNEGSCLYILFKQNVPVSSVVYSKQDDHMHLELVTTNKNYRAMGFAKLLTMQSFEDLANDEIQDVSLIVNDTNYRSHALQKSISGEDGIKTYARKCADLTEYTFDISALSNQNSLEY